jgi:hypothetical protein
MTMQSESPKLTLDEPRYGLRFSVQFDRVIFDRPQFYYWVSAFDPQGFTEPVELDQGDTLQLGAAHGADELSEALSMLLDFVGAYCEALDYQRRTGTESDNGSMFSAELGSAIESAGFSSDDAAMLAESLRGRDDE